MCHYTICTNNAIISSFYIRKNRCVGSYKTLFPIIACPIFVYIKTRFVLASRHKICTLGAIVTSFPIEMSHEWLGSKLMPSCKFGFFPTFIPFAIAISIDERSSIFSKCLRIYIYIYQIKHIPNFTSFLDFKRPMCYN